VSDRDAVLAAVRRAAARRVPHPGPHPPPPLAGGFEAFARALAEAGGAAHGPLAPDELGPRVAELVRARAGGGRVVAAPAAAARLGPGPWEEARDDAEPRSFADVAVAVLLGSAAAAECGAVAVEGRLARQRALPFLCAHLVLLVPAQAVAPDLHTAFALLPRDAAAHHHVTWIAGPSKTADIEQTLVLGAHGPLGLDAVVLA
jgi:L-lactate dehydrogenase complex protein LldG